MRGKSKLPTVSVVVPHFEMEHSLGELIIALGKATYPNNLMEVIVVDNGSSVAPLLPRSDLKLRLLREPKPGSYRARNTALKNAYGNVIAFTDADCLPEAEWLMAGVTCLLSGADRVAGDIKLIRQPNTGRGTFLYQRAFTFDVQGDLAGKAHVATANMFLWKHIIDRVGQFDEMAFSGGDKEWSLRFHEMGFRSVFCPDATVWHPSRSLTELVRHRKRLAGAVRAGKTPEKRASIFKREFMRLRLGALERTFSSSEPFVVKVSALSQGLVLFVIQLSWSVWFSWFSRLSPPRN